MSEKENEMTDIPGYQQIDLGAWMDGSYRYTEDPYEDWGPWRLRVDNLTLDCGEYYVDLERCLTSAAVLDWIMQVAGKSWADSILLSGLVHALNAVLHPQGNLCSRGLNGEPDKTISQAEIPVLAARHHEWIIMYGSRHPEWLATLDTRRHA